MNVQPYDRATVVQLNNDVLVIEGEIIALQHRLDELKDTRTGLDRQLSNLSWSEVPPTPEFDPALVNAVASNLSALPTEEEIEASLDRQADVTAENKRRREVWEAQGRLVGQAMDEVDGQIATTNAALGDAQKRRDDAFNTFVRGAYSSLMDQFTAEFAAMKANLLDPLEALAQYSSVRQGRIVSVRMPQLRDFVMIVDQHDGQRNNSEQLYPLPTARVDRMRLYPDRIAALRASLQKPPVANG